MCNDLGMSRSTMTELRKGRVKTLKLEKASKIADYFGVSIDYLLGTEKEKFPAETSEGIDDEDIKVAFYGGYKDALSEDDIEALWNDAKEYIMFKAEQKKKGKGNS